MRKILAVLVVVLSAFNVTAQDFKPGNTIATTSTNGGNTFPSTYDTIGRFITLGANLKF